MLYDKSCEDYSNKEAKKQLYQQKALELGWKAQVMNKANVYRPG